MFADPSQDKLCLRHFIQTKNISILSYLFLFIHETNKCFAHIQTKIIFGKSFNATNTYICVFKKHFFYNISYQLTVMYSNVAVHIS